MAQLDFVTYLYQFSWLTGLFFSLYLILLKWIFPAISTALKGRLKKRILTRKSNYSMKQYSIKNAKKCSLQWDTIFKLQERHLKYFQIQQLVYRLKLASLLI